VCESPRFGFQPWHSATEFGRAVRQYLSDFHSLSILSCLDLTGYYQYESIHLPIYFFLQSQGVDFQFGIKIRNIETAVNQNGRTISRLAVSQNGLEFKKLVGDSDIVIATLGSTVSGSAIGTNDLPPAWHSIEAGDHLNANWALWLEAGNKYPDYGNPYTFCTRKSESILESFTVTTEHIGFVDYLQSRLQRTCQSGAIILMENSNWGLRLCLPVQPVFAQQAHDVRVLWGFALFPENEGEHVKKNMLACSGAEIMSEILYHLDASDEMAAEVLQRSITIPRAMPRMSSGLLTRSLQDRPCIIPESIVNLGLVGSFIETPWRTCVDTSYGVHAAQKAVSHLMGIKDWPEDPPGPSIMRLLATLLCK
jgi:oleate hydratase